MRTGVAMVVLAGASALVVAASGVACVACSLGTDLDDLNEKVIVLDGAPPEGGDGVDAGAGADTGASADAGAGEDAGGEDAGRPSVDAAVQCPDVACADGKICCMDSARNMACRTGTKASDCGGEIFVTCDDSLQCTPDHVCCLKRADDPPNNNPPTGLSCVPTQACSGVLDVIRCDPEGPSFCPDGGYCGANRACQNP